MQYTNLQFDARARATSLKLDILEQAPRFRCSKIWTGTKGKDQKKQTRSIYVYEFVYTHQCLLFKTAVMSILQITGKQK